MEVWENPYKERKQSCVNSCLMFKLLFVSSRQRLLLVLLVAVT